MSVPPKKKKPTHDSVLSIDAQEAANKAVAKKGKTGAVAKKESAAKQRTAGLHAKRNLKIVIDRTGMKPWDEIAKDAKLTVESCRHIYYKYLRTGGPKLKASDPLAIAYEGAERYEHMQEELARISRTSKNENARVGAIRAQMEALEKQIRLYQVLGVLPHDIGALITEVDVRYLATKLEDFLQRFDPSPDDWRELAVVLRRQDGVGAGSPDLN